MKTIDEARNDINRIDKEMAELFLRRMEAVGVIAENKKQRGLPIFDEKRENEVVLSNSEYIDDPTLREYYVNFIRDVMKTSRAYQTRLTSGMRVAYSGTVGAFAYIAAEKIFPQGTLVPFGNFTEAYDSVVNGDCDCAVLPLENSFAGEVGQVVDMLFSGSLSVSGVYDLPVVHDLVAMPGVKKENIRRIVSHPQALSQCAEFIRRGNYEQIQYENTAMAAKYVARAKDPTLAAICSEECASVFGLTVLERHINESRSNTTRFGVFTRASAPLTLKPAPENRFILMFTVRHEAGSLARVINLLGKYGFNMTSLRSRPMKELLWQYYFYVECEGTLDEAEGKKLLQELSASCDRLKLAGTFAAKTL